MCLPVGPSVHCRDSREHFNRRGRARYGLSHDPNSSSFAFRGVSRCARGGLPCHHRRKKRPAEAVVTIVRPLQQFPGNDTCSSFASTGQMLAQQVRHALNEGSLDRSLTVRVL
jgi:hypothetical protein